MDVDDQKTAIVEEGEKPEAATTEKTTEEEASVTTKTAAEETDAAAAESPRKSGRKVKPTEKVLEAADSPEEESVEAIAKELANTPAAATTKTTSPKKAAGKEAGE